MNTENPGPPRSGFMPPPLPMMGGGQELYEQFLALADKLGAAYAEAYQKITAAYMQAYERVGLGVGRLQEKLTNQPGPAGLGAMTLPNLSEEQLSNAKDRAVEIGDKLTDTSAKIGLAYLAAHEQAMLALADCHEQIADASSLEVVKTTAAAHAELARKVTKAGADTLRTSLA